MIKTAASSSRIVQVKMQHYSPLQVIVYSSTYRQIRCTESNREYQTFLLGENVRSLETR